MILVDIGEIGIHTGADCYKLRPSLYAISQLGSPAEIVRLYGAVMGEAPILADVLGVIHACAQEDVSHVFGCFVPARAPGAKGLRYVPGTAKVADTAILARSLLRHGVTGALPPQEAEGDEPAYSAEFDARSYVALAMAHLGATSAEAWQMTMTELVGAMRAKFPPIKDQKRPAKPMTAPEYDATMEYGDAIMAKLAKRKNGAK